MARPSPAQPVSPDDPSEGWSQRDRQRETRSAAVVAGGILLSRLAGLLRQRVTAYYFGTSALADVVGAAFRIGNITQNLLGEGTLSASFIPVYVKLRAEGKHDEARRFVQAALGLLCAAVLVLSALGMALAPWLTWAITPGFDAAKIDRTASLVRLLFPMTGLLVLCALGLGVLNSHRRFFLPYVAPVIWNAAQITALLLAGGLLLLRDEALARALAWGAFGGAAIELAVLLGRARPLIGTLRPRWDLANRHLREAARRLPGALLGRGVIQFSGLIDTVLVSFLGTGAYASFHYAQMLYLLPMSLLGTAEAAVSLPEMSRDTAETDRELRNARMRARLGSALSRVLVLATGAMACFLVFGRELITLLLQTGRFDQESTARVAQVLFIYGFAILANASGRLFATTCFALGDTRRPARYAICRLVASTAVALVLMWRLGVVGVVVGAAVAGWLEALLLARQVRKRLGGLGLAELRLGRVLVLALITVAVPLGVRELLPGDFGQTPLGSAVILTALGCAFVAGTQLLGLFDLRALLRRR